MYPRILVYLSLLIAMLIWGSSFIAMKQAFTTFDWIFVIFARMAVGLICFLVVIRAIYKFTYRKGDWILLMFMALCEPCLYFIFESLALKNTSASQAGMITALAPLMVGVTALFVLKEQLAKNAWIGFIIAVIGTIWLTVSSETTESAPNPLLGNFLEVCAMACAVGYVLAVKVLSERYSTWLLTAIQTLAGTIFFAFLLPFSEWPETITLKNIAPILYLGIFVSIGAYGLYNFALSQIKSAEATAFANLIPVSTAIMAYFFLGERLNTQQLIACVVTLLGVVLSQIHFKRTKKNTS